MALFIPMAVYPKLRRPAVTIEVQVTVRTSDGQIAGGLTRDDFELYDNGKSLAAFRALPGAEVEVLVRSSAGARYCTISAKDKAAIR